MLLAPKSGATANIQQAVEELSAVPVSAETAANRTLTITRRIQSGPATGASGAEAAPSVDGATITEMLQTALGSLLTIAADVTIVLFLAAFLLAAGPSLRQHVVDAAGRREDRELVTSIVDDVNAQIQRFLLVRLLTAVLVGLATWAVLAWMQVAHAAVWGSLSGVFNSIPYCGPVIVSGGLLLVGLVQDGSMSRAVEMSGAALLITTLEGWLLTPLLHGKAERMNIIVVFLGVLIWSWIWGPWGTLLAVPMMVVCKPICDHVERLKPLSRLRGHSDA
jgi:predicted PurR-regulated permease PerM